MTGAVLLGSGYGERVKLRDSGQPPRWVVVSVDGFRPGAKFSTEEVGNMLYMDCLAEGDTFRDELTSSIWTVRKTVKNYVIWHLVDENGNAWKHRRNYQGIGMRRI